jgi:hypothetical protein
MARKVDTPLDFTRNHLDTGLKSPEIYKHLRLKRVIYKERQQKEMIRSILPQEAPTAGEALDSTAQDFGGFEYLFNDCLLMIQELLLDQIVSFKHPAFLDEREWRLVARSDFRVELEGGALGAPIPHFQTSGGYVVPFTKLKPIKGKLPLASVRFGPSLDFTRYKMPAVQFLASNGYSDVELNGSDLPVRLS